MVVNFFCQPIPKPVIDLPSIFLKAQANKVIKW